MKQEAPEMSSSSIVYAEYVRLSKASESLTSSSFEDFKLMAVVGAILGLKPLADAIAGSRVGPGSLFVGFMGLFFIIAIIAFRDLLKQSLITYIGHHLVRYERVIAEHVPEAHEKDLFRTYSEAERWLKKRHMPLVLAFNAVFLFPALVIPAFILWNIPPSVHDRAAGSVYAIIYLLICIGIYLARLYLSIRMAKPLKASGRGR